jgi:AraC-like DNA-binding protein
MVNQNSGNTANNIVQYSRVDNIPGLELFRGLSVTRFVSRHVHELFCLTILDAGVRICETKKGRDYLTPGDIFISNYGEAHSGSVPQGHTYSCHSLRLDPTLLCSLISDLGSRCPDSFYFAKPLLNDQELYQKILLFHDTAPRQSFTLDNEYRLLDVFSHLYTHHASERIDAPQPGGETAPIRRVREYLQECFNENVSIEKLSSIAALSPFHLCRVFEKEVGVPPHVYQLDIRLIRAAKMLSRGKKIADVATETGFFDQSHFHKAFQRKFGITPKRYMQR